MASITSSQIVIDNPQVDRRRIVREAWIDDMGNEFFYDYMATAAMDITARMNARTADVLALATYIQDGV